MLKQDASKITNKLNTKDSILLIAYLLNDLTSLSTQQLMIRQDFPECLHCLPILPTFINDNDCTLKLFWCHDQMEQDIVEQMFGAKGKEYTKPIYFSDDGQCIDILSQTKNKEIYCNIINIKMLSEAILRVFSHNHCKHPKTNLFNITENQSKFCQLLKIIFNHKRPSFVNHKRFRNDDEDKLFQRK